jgi:excisionase family DNA binding protein
MDAMPDILITTTISNFCRLTGIGRSKTYELLAAGDLDSIKIGKRRLIVLDSYRKLIEQQQRRTASSTVGPGASQRVNAPTASPRRRGRPPKVLIPNPRSSDDPQRAISPSTG